MVVVVQSSATLQLSSPHNSQRREVLGTGEVYIQGELLQCSVVFECCASLDCRGAFRAAIKRLWELSGQAAGRGHLSLPALALLPLIC